MSGSLPPTANGATPSARRRSLRSAAPRRRALLAVVPELALLLALYALYRVAQKSAPLHVDAAVARGRDLIAIEGRIGADIEHAANGWLTAHPVLANAADYYYAVMHFGVTLGVLVWLWTRHRDRFPVTRNTLAATNLLALVAFWLVPTAPPRLIPGAGFVDTVVHFHTWGSFASPQGDASADQFASIPSLHVGWALWCAVAVTAASTSALARRLIWLYPLATSLVVIGTGNHYVADVVGGAVVLVLGRALATALSRTPLPAAVAGRARMPRPAAHMPHVVCEPVGVRRAA